MADASRAEWRPLEVAELRALLSRQRAAWWVAGGFALELFAGSSWRTHGDLDAGVLRADQRAVFGALGGWQRFAAHAGELVELRPDEVAPPEVNSIWCRRSGEEAFAFELLLDDSERSEWIFRRDPRVRRPLSEVWSRSDEGCPYLRPEIQLLYKAKARRDRDESDFAAVAPLLDGEARRWLRDALALGEPDHDWLARLAEP